METTPQEGSNVSKYLKQDFEKMKLENSMLTSSADNNVGKLYQGKFCGFRKNSTVVVDLKKINLIISRMKYCSSFKYYTKAQM